MNDATRRRKSLRLPVYDYSSPGAYFVTICTERRLTLFGEITDDDMQLNHAGAAIADCWRRLPTKFGNAGLGDFVVMPNHLHGIIWIRDDDGETHTSLPGIIDWFKTMTTNQYIRGVGAHGWPRFGGRLWQRGYHLARDTQRTRASGDHEVHHREPAEVGARRGESRSGSRALEPARGGRPHGAAPTRA